MKFSQETPQRGHGKKRTNPAPAVQGREATTADVNVSEGQAQGKRQPGQQNEDREEQNPDRSRGKYHASDTNRTQAHEWGQQALGCYVRADRGPCSGLSS